MKNLILHAKYIRVIQTSLKKLLSVNVVTKQQIIIINNFEQIIIININNN